jgi:hypothetical protein
MEDLLAANQAQMADMEKSWDDKLKEGIEKQKELERKEAARLKKE